PESSLHLPTEEPSLGYLKFSAKGTKREVFGMPIPNELITDDIRGADYYDAYLEKVAKHQRYLAGEELVDEFVDEGIPLTEPGFGDLEADTQRAIEESLKDAHGAPRGPLPPVVFRETDTGKFQPLPEVEGKEKVDAEQAAQVLLNLQTPKKKSPTKQYIFQRRTSAPTEPSGHDKSSSLYVELGLTESDTESDKEMPPVVKSGDQDEGQRENRPVWNNVQRVNHQNQFVPTAVLTRTGRIQVNTARTSGTNTVNTARHNFNSQAVPTNAARKVHTVKPIDYPQRALQNKGIVDSGCSRHMTGNKAYLAEYQDYNGGPVAFGGSKGYITGKGKIKTRKLDFEDVCFVKELQHFNLFSVSQMCDKKNKVLFTDTECLVLSPDFKLPDENQVLLRVPRQNNMYSFNLENIVPSRGLACLIAKATVDESNKWHRRLGHVNFKNLNKLVKGNLVRGLPSKIFQNDHTCVACQKGKQHKASCKAKSVSSISQPLQLLHMDLFGPTSVRSLNHKTYCLVITDDFSRFSWVFFLRTKDETSGILKDFIRQIENQLNQKVKTIRCDNGTEFKNRDFIEFCGSKGIKREYSNARTPQQNGVAERKNMTLIEAARTMLADSFLPNTF
ncbi:putative ribonuclease H-like domain-containing protein, partial [Tanacetum coccineum]